MWIRDSPDMGMREAGTLNSDRVPYARDYFTEQDLGIIEDLQDLWTWLQIR